MPALCSCPEGHRLDGLICRAPLQCSEEEEEEGAEFGGGGGGDVDGDGVPNSCDTCPYVFNPDQSPHPCQPLQGVCPGGVAAGVLWSATSAELTDRKPCPPPLIGRDTPYLGNFHILIKVSILVKLPYLIPDYLYLLIVGFTSRQCGANGSWEQADLIGCVSVEGQLLLTQVSALESGQILSVAELRSAASALTTFTSRFQGNMLLPMVGGDVQVAGRMLSQLLNQLEALSDSGGVEGEAERIVESLVTTADNLLNPDLSSAWRSVVEGVEFDSGRFLMYLEALSLAVSREVPAQQFLHDNLLIQSHDLSSGSHDPFVITFNESTTTITMETNTSTSLSVLTFGLFPTLGDLLPMRALFNISHLIVATPILSIQVADAGGSEFTCVSVNLTLPYRQPVARATEVGGATCVAWSYEER